MSDAGFIAIVATCGVTVLGAGASAAFSSFIRRRDDQARRNGERMGAIESALDFERGRQAGLREAAVHRAEFHRACRAAERVAALTFRLIETLDLD